MYFPRSSAVSTLATFASLASAVISASVLNRRNPNSTCLTFGIDFQDQGTYFINQASTEQFTAVSQFEGCNTDVADVWFVPPESVGDGDEISCSDIPTTPDNTNEVSTCPIQKNQLVSGDYKLILIGNNGDGNPFAWERDFHLNVGPQATTTVTPTITLNVTTTPHATITQTSTLLITSTLNATTTYTVPASTAACTKTVRPRPVTTTAIKTITWHRYRYTHSASITTVTKTASCTVPPKPNWPDPTMTYHPKRFHPPSGMHWGHKRGAHRMADHLQKRAPDAPTVTVSASPAVSVTQTIPGLTTVTDTASTAVTSTLYTTLSPSTVKTGVHTVTTTLPTPTRTKLRFTYTVALTTKTFSFTYTYTKTTTPSAVKTACKESGGHFGGRW